MNENRVTIRCLNAEKLEELACQPNIRFYGVMGWDVKEGIQEEFIHVIDTDATPEPGDKVFVRRSETGDEYYKEFGTDSFEGVEIIGVLYGVYNGPIKPMKRLFDTRSVQDPAN